MMNLSFSRLAAFSLAALLGSSALALTANDYLAYVIMVGAIFATLAVAFDVLLGYTGYLSLAHGALYGVGAYVCAILTARYDVGFWFALLAAAAASAAIGALIAAVAFRTRGLYFAVLTLGLGLVGEQLFLVFDGVTGGIGGFAGIPGPVHPPWLTASTPVFYALLSLGLLFVTFLCANLFVRSRLGAECIAIREDLILAQALGIKVSAARLAAFTFSAAFAGAAGALFAATSSFVAPESFTVLGTGFLMVALVVVGGMGTLWGPIIGAALLTALPEVLRFASTYSLLAYGILLLTFIIFFPRGLADLLKRLTHKLKHHGEAR
jgi:branched-chain amino acid transport system permease protein